MRPEDHLVPLVKRAAPHAEDDFEHYSSGDALGRFESPFEAQRELEAAEKYPALGLGLGGLLGAGLGGTLGYLNPPGRGSAGLGAGLGALAGGGLGALLGGGAGSAYALNRYDNAQDEIIRAFDERFAERPAESVADYRDVASYGAAASPDGKLLAILDDEDEAGNPVSSVYSRPRGARERLGFSRDAWWRG